MVCFFQYLARLPSVTVEFLIRIVIAFKVPCDVIPALEYDLVKLLLKYLFPDYDDVQIAAIMERRKMKVPIWTKKEQVRKFLLTCKCHQCFAQAQFCFKTFSPWWIGFDIIIPIYICFRLRYPDIDCLSRYIW